MDMNEEKEKKKDEDPKKKEGGLYRHHRRVFHPAEIHENGVQRTKEGEREGKGG